MHRNISIIEYGYKSTLPTHHIGYILEKKAPFDSIFFAKCHKYCPLQLPINKNSNRNKKISQQPKKQINTKKIYLNSLKIPMFMANRGIVIKRNSLSTSITGKNILGPYHLLRQISIIQNPKSKSFDRNSEGLAHPNGFFKYKNRNLREIYYYIEKKTCQTKLFSSKYRSFPYIPKIGVHPGGGFSGDSFKHL